MSDMATRDDPSTVADYEAFVEGLTGDDRWKLIRGRIVSVTNPSQDHEQIVGGVFARLRIAMEAAGCRAYAGGMRVEHFRRGASAWVVEVLSSPSRRLDPEAVGFTVDLDTIYCDVPVLRPAEVPGEGEAEPPTPIA